MKVNYHFHCRCSFDSDTPLLDMCRAAEAAGLTHLCLTDHCDLMDEYGKTDDSFSWPAEDAELTTARAHFPALTIRRGIELGQALERPEAAVKILSDPEIDFVLGSVHNRPGDKDYYWLEYRDRQQCINLLEEYLNALLALAKSPYLDSLAHLTYPVRYMKKAGFTVDLLPLSDLVDCILRALIDNGKALELNTSGYRQGLEGPLPDAWILARYRELGGELLTIGTDAHEPAHISGGLDRGAALLLQLNFRYITLYENRNPKQVLLEDVI